MSLKRIFDLFLSTALLLALMPLLLLIAIIIKVTSEGPVLFLQDRVGRKMEIYKIFKFRTMANNGGIGDLQITKSGDPRITSVGKVLRKYKLDELPQLINIFIGNMSFVGPRPEVPKYVAYYRELFERTTEVYPGLTDMASLKYINEEAELAAAVDAEECYIKKILPDKLRLAVEYIEKRSFMLDLSILFKTALHMARMNK